MIFQEPMTSLNPLHTVEKQINEMLILHKGLGPHDVGDRVHCTDFVKVYFLQSRTMHFGFGLGKSRKDIASELLLRFTKSAAINHVSDVMQVTVSMLGLVLNGQICCAKAVPFDFFGDQLA
jgi:ABC-type dipeptide/oligopeptide/nickel transport system ATPase component